MQYNCWSLRCGSSSELVLTLGFNGLSKVNCKPRRETFKFGDFLQLILEVWSYMKATEHGYAEYVYNSLVKYFGIFNHVKTIISKKIARQLYFAFIHSRIRYGIEIVGDCANEYLQKLQVIQNKLLKLLLNFDRRMSTNDLHQQLSLLKVVDIHTVNVLSFVDECRSGRCPTLFSSYYHVREAEYELRQNDRLHVSMARTNTGQSSCKIKGARLWKNKFNLVNPHLYKKSFRKTITKHFIETYH